MIATSPNSVFAARCARPNASDYVFISPMHHLKPMMTSTSVGTSQTREPLGDSFKIK
ncbi:MAG: hypothetical protein HZC11_08420 [Nitrospirae bacterium]|nr:hypothetical protein [Nitrospirota bacterium]